MFNFEKLDVFREAIEFVKDIYKITEKFPSKEQFGIISQIRRASVSIVTNIAEGSGRFHKKDFQQFLRMSRSSGYECVALLNLSKELGYLELRNFETLCKKINKIAKMTNGLINSLSRR
jgi:four helix bundle protein